MESVQRRKFMSSLAGIGSATAISGNLIGEGRANPGSPEFDPTDEEEVAEYISEFFERVQNRKQRVQSFKKGDAEARGLEEEVRSLSNEQKEAIQEYMENYASIEYNTGFWFSSTENQEVSTTSEWSRGKYTESISAEVTVPNPNPLLPDPRFHAFDYSQTLEWYYNGDEVKDADVSTTPNGKYYVIVGWNFKEDKEKSLDPHPENYYVESHTQAIFNRMAFADFVTPRNDYATIKAAGYRNGNGRTVKKTVNGN